MYLTFFPTKMWDKIISVIKKTLYIYFYSKTNQMHQFLWFICFGNNKLQKLVHLVGLTIETYYDAETYERQTAYISLLCLAPRPESVDI